MRGEGVRAQQLAVLFDLARRKAGLAEHGPQLSTAAFRRPAPTITGAPVPLQTTWFI